MKKANHQILQIFFLLIIINEIVIGNSEDQQNPDIPQSTPQNPDIPQSTPQNPDTPQPTTIDQATKERQKTLCEDTQPLKGIKEECYTGNPLISGETCCYMTIKYETNDYYKCVAVKKDITSIKEKIDNYKKDYEGSKSIYIDCNSSLIRISLFSLFLFFIF